MTEHRNAMIESAASIQGGPVFDVNAYHLPTDADWSVALRRAIAAAASAAPYSVVSFGPRAMRFDGPTDIGSIPLSFYIAPGAVLTKDKAASAIFIGSDVNGVSFDGGGLFLNDPTTADFDQDHRFVLVTRCHDVYVGPLRFNALNANGKPTLFSLFENQAGDRMIQKGTCYRGSAGNCTGANGDGTGKGGQDCTFYDVECRDFVDTGIGLWTGARRAQILGGLREAFPVAGGNSNYTRVGVDCAGVTDALIAGGTTRRCTKGVRVLTNLVYTSQNVRIRDHHFTGQEATRSEPAACVQINRSDTQDMSVSVRGCKLDVVGFGLIGYSTNASGVLRVEMDDNDISGGNGAAGVTLQGLRGAGAIELVPGTNRFHMTGTGVAATQIGASLRTLDIDTTAVRPIDSVRSSRASVSFHNSATTNVLWEGTLAPGVYRVVLSWGAMTDASTGVNASILGTATTFDQTMANSDFTYIATVNTAGNTTIQYTSHAAGNNYTILGVRIERVI